MLGSKAMKSQAPYAHKYFIFIDSYLVIDSTTHKGERSTKGLTNRISSIFHI